MAVRGISLGLHLLVAAGCGSGPMQADDAAQDAPDADDGGDRDGTDAVPDATDEDVEDRGDAVDPRFHCGDGLVNFGEECDDGNRMNGDGCAWDCRRGDGQDPSDASPDPDAGTMDPDASFVPVDTGDLVGAGVTVRNRGRIPFLWTGSNYAVLWPTDDPTTSDEAWNIAFARLDRSGDIVDAPWTYSFARDTASADLAWNGSEFGLLLGAFVADPSVRYVRLDADGKPMSDPVVIGELAEELASAGAVRIVADDGGYACSWAGPRFTRIDVTGTARAGPPTALELDGQTAAQLASSGSTYLLAWAAEIGPDVLVRYLVLDRDQRTLVGPRTIAPVDFPVVRTVWTGAEYAVLWMVPGPATAGEWHQQIIHVARFDAEGIMLGPPAHEPIAGFAPPGDGGSNVAAGHDSLAWAFPQATDGIIIYRFDLYGIFIERIVLDRLMIRYDYETLGFVGLAFDESGLGLVARGHLTGAESLPGLGFFRFEIDP